MKTYHLSVPSSKSYTHRVLIIAALSDSISKLEGLLKCRDTDITCISLKRMGVKISNRGKYTFVKGLGKKIKFNSYGLPIYLGNSGTSMRLLSGFLSLGQGEYIIVGTKRIYSRPMYDLTKALKSIGVFITFLRGNGHLPIEISVTESKVKKVIKIDCSLSSQFLSSLLLISPCLNESLKIITTNKLVSRPYIDITIDIMLKFGIIVKNISCNSFYIPKGQKYRSIEYKIEPDCSHACYFWAAAALTGKSITIKNLSLSSKQGEIKFLYILKKMGCFVYEENFGLTVKGVNLNSVKVDMTDMPDSVPTLAILAAFAKGISIITGISHLEGKESNRIKAITRGLKLMKIDAANKNNKLIIKGGDPRSSIIDTCEDHRIAMSFALAGLKTSGVKIKNASCVDKSFPEFWDKFRKICN